MALTDRQNKRAGGPPQLEVVAIEDLNVDQTYQRPLNQLWVEKLLEDWDLYAADPLTVSRRKRPSAADREELNGDGTLWIVNGQHHAQAARLSGEPEVFAFVWDGLTVAQEADLRLKKNNGKPDTAQEKFHGNVVKGDPEALAIVELLTKHGTAANRSPNAHSGVNCVGTLGVLYRDSPELLDQALGLIREAFDEIKGEEGSATVLRAHFWFQKVHGSFARKSFVERVSKAGYAELMRIARANKAAMRGPDWLNYYRALVETYNYGRPEHTRLEVRTKYSARIDNRHIGGGRGA